MMIALHKNATTAPAVRAQIQQSSASESELAARYGISRTTVQRWKDRDSVEDRSHTPHRLQTTLNAGQEELVVYLRKQLHMPLDDLLSVVREFIYPTMGRSSLHRLLVRRGIDKLPKPSPESSPAKPFKAYEPGYVHIDVKYLPQMADEPSRGYVFVAIDRATRWVFIGIKRGKTAAAARSFLNEVAEAAPFVIKTILTDNGKEFTDRLFGGRAKEASGEHEFDLLCESLGIKHRLTKPRTPRTNGMVERFNGRLEQVLQTHRFNSAEGLSKTLHRYVWLYNQHLPQKALNHETPLMALKRWQESHPHLFKKRVANHPGPDSYRPARAALHPGVGVLLLTHVNDRTGAMHDRVAASAAAHAIGALTAWGLARSAGAVPVDLRGSNADFAVGCGSRYLNGGLGSPAVVLVNPQHVDRCEQPLSGW